MKKRKILSATAGSRTRVNGLGSRHDNRYTTVAQSTYKVIIYGIYSRFEIGAADFRQIKTRKLTNAKLLLLSKRNFL